LHYLSRVSLLSMLLFQALGPRDPLRRELFVPKIDLPSYLLLTVNGLVTRLDELVSYRTRP